MKKVWIKKDLVTLHDLEEMQKKMDSMKSPVMLGAYLENSKQVFQISPLIS